MMFQVALAHIIKLNEVSQLCILPADSLRRICFLQIIQMASPFGSKISTSSQLTTERVINPSFLQICNKY